MLLCEEFLKKLVLRRWGIEAQSIGIIKRIDKVSYPTVRKKGGADVSSVSPSSFVDTVGIKRNELEDKLLF